MKRPDPTKAIYEILDEAGLTAGNLLATRVSMAKMVNMMRGEIARKLKEYIEARETEEQDG